MHDASHRSLRCVCGQAIITLPGTSHTSCWSCPCEGPYQKPQDFTRGLLSAGSRATHLNWAGWNMLSPLRYIQVLACRLPIERRRPYRDFIQHMGRQLQLTLGSPQQGDPPGTEMCNHMCVSHAHRERRATSYTTRTTIDARAATTGMCKADIFSTP